MKINLPFDIKEKEDWNYFAEENNAEGGIWPLANNMRWHTGIHLKPNNRYSLLRPLIPGTIIAARFCDDYKNSPFGSKYSNSFVLMKHYFGSKRIPFYILYSELGSKKAIEEHEFISYKDEEGNEIYRPLFCRKWFLKENTVDSINTHLVAYYTDENKNQIKGYFNRDGMYVITETPDGVFYITGNTKSKQFYLKCDNSNKPSGFSSREEKWAYFARNREYKNFNGWIQLYYDKNYLYPKVKININELSRVIKNENLGNVYTINYVTKQGRVENSFKTDEFYIFTDKECKVNKKGNAEVILKEDKESNLIIKQDNNVIKICNYTKNKILQKLETDSKNPYIKKWVYKSISNDNDYKCFKGDKLQLEKIDNADGIYQYKAKKLSTSEDVKGTVHYGYIKESDYKFCKLCTYMMNYNSNKSNALFPEHTSSIIVYDVPGKNENGITVCPSTSINKNEIIEVKKHGNDYYALIKIPKPDEKYKTSALINESESYFYGYVKLNKTELTNCINREYKDNKDYKNTITTIPNDLPAEYNGPIAIFDSNTDNKEDYENDFELHIELFFTSLDDFNFKKNHKKKDGNIEDLIEIQDTSVLFKAKNEKLLKNENFYINYKKKYEHYEELQDKEKTITMKFFSDKKGKIVPLKYINEIYIDFTYANLKKTIISVQSDSGSQEIKIKTKKKHDKEFIKFSAATKIQDIEIAKKSEFEIEDIGNDKYRFLVESTTVNTGYYIFSKDLGSANEKNPTTLNEQTYIYISENIELEKISDKVETHSQLICYDNCLSVIINGLEYYKFNLNGKNYFIKADDIDNATVITEKYSESEEQNDDTVINKESSKAYNVFDLPGFVLLKDTSEDYICDIDELFEKTGLDKTKIQQEKTIEELVYKMQDQQLYKQLSRLVIQCPSMWELPEGFENQKEVQKKYIRDIGYWGVSEGKDTDDVADYLKDLFFLKSDNKTKLFGEGIGKTKEYYYFHPFRFLYYYTEKTLQEFNPYCGRIFVDLPDKSGSHGGINVVLNNPGFAPKYIFNHANDDKYEHYLSKNKTLIRFALTTGLFNENYLAASKRYIRERYKFFHEGIDLRGTWDKEKPKVKGTEIYSFIFGEIIAFGKHDNYGNSIIIKKENYNDYYLLAHLSYYMDEIKIGKKISPGDIVGYVGGSGASSLSAYSPHLHISFYNSANVTKKTLWEIYNELESKDENNNFNYLRNPIRHKGEKDLNVNN